jgi:beta-amylase
MMPLDMVNNNGDLVNPTKLGNDLKKLKSVGTDGVMVDIWWGIVEKQPQVYTWNPYKQFMQLCKEIGLQVQVVLSFHQCGTNVGDACYITLPQWVLNSCDGDCFYTDREGYRDKEYLSLGVDTQNIFPTRNGGKRTAVDMYSDLMRDFASQFSSFMGSVITTIDVGLGPAGELRYPSYQLQNGRWVFPGVGEFQNYDRYMMANLSASARAIGHPEWGLAGPDDAGTYKSYPPYNIPFYRDDGHWNQDYGRFFLTWYSDQLLQHGRSILSRARSIFGDMKIAAKIAGIHWWYMTNSHAAELTAGYYNTINRDGYDIIAQMFAENSIMFQFTCLEMFNDDSCKCGAQNLVAETRDSAWKMGIMYAGENALPIDGNQNGYNQIVRQSKVNGRKIDAFTYLRLGPNLVDNQNNLNMFQRFVQTMHSL